MQSKGPQNPQSQAASRPDTQMSADGATPAAFAITLKLTTEQNQWLENAAQFIANETNCQVSHSSVILRLMEIGLPLFEQELQALRARANAQRKRFPKLQLLLTR